ncbi:MAG: 50S ribosomal protein L25/general stress protein Ctc, partial [Acidimicrobiia bacterium]
MEITLKAQPRSATGKGAARKARAAGEVPGVVYGIGIDPITLSINAREMMTALHTEAGSNVLINLQLDSKTKYFT